MYEKIMITSDSTCDLSPELLEKYNIKVLPLNVKLGNQLYLDGEEVNANDVFAHVTKTKELPVTSEPTLTQTHNFFAKYIFRGYTIIHFTISAEMSKSYNNAAVVAGQLGRIFVVDTRTASCGVGLLAVHAAEMVEEGLSVEEIISNIRKLAVNVRSTLIVDDLEFLKKGGRVSGIAALSAGLLKLKPNIIVTQAGVLDTNKNYRGNFDTVVPEFIKTELKNVSGIDPRHIFVASTGCPKNIIDLAVSEIKKLGNFNNIHVMQTGCTIASHLGPNALLLFFINKPTK